MLTCRNERSRLVMRIFAMGAVLLLAAACSVAGLAYNNAVPLASWYIDDYVSLDDVQQVRFRESISRLHVWHRRSELPEYSRVLEDAARKVERPVAPEDIQQLYEDGRRFANRVGEQALPDMVELLLTLSPDQVKAIEDKLQRDNEKFESERMRQPAARREKDRVDRYVKNLENWFGGLDAEQKGLVRTGLANIPSTDEQRLADRRRLQREFLALLRNPPPKPQFVARLRTILFTPEVGRDPAYQATNSAWRQRSSALFASVLAKASPGQRVHLQRKLRGYASDVTALIASS